jgi:hypothetical protein
VCNLRASTHKVGTRDNHDSRHDCEHDIGSTPAIMSMRSACKRLAWHNRVSNEIITITITICETYKQSAVDSVQITVTVVQGWSTCNQQRR